MMVRHLSYFVTLARERHFARAADACNVAQPTLSAAIRKLEEDLGARLVIRGPRFAGLTPEGERVLAWARQILSDYASLREDLSTLRQGLVGTLRLGVIPAAMPSVAFVTARFCAEHPAADMEIHSLTSRAIQHGLDAFDLDGGVTYLENEPLEHVRRAPLYRERYVFVTHRTHPFAGRRSLTWREAVAQRLCLLSGDMQNRRILNNIAASAGLVWHDSVEDMVKVCDVVTINAPLHSETENLFNDAMLARMKRGAYLVNTARGKICDRDAVVRALESGQLAGYAGDVWFPQPAPRDHPWRTMPHHGMTPHISGASLSAQTRYAAGVREILECYFEGRPIRDEYLIVQGGKLAGAGAHAYAAGDATGGSEEAARFKSAARA
jgi:DNA-binding transcriptional LysR family regulator